MMQTKPPGKVKNVTSAANPAVKAIRSLVLKKNRDASGLFLAEGLKLVTDALEQDWEIDTLIHLRNGEPRIHIDDVSARARARGATILEANERVLSAISRRDNPQTVIGVFAQRWYSYQAISTAGNPLWIALDRIRDPGNLGTIIRTADAVGASGVILVDETTDPFSVEAVRATMGSLFTVPICRMTQDAFVDWRSSWQGLVIGTHLNGEIDFRQPDYANQPVLLLMGNESQGLPDQLAACCDHLCLIPMAGAADSLNLAVATGIMAFEIRRHALSVIGKSVT